MNLAKKYRELKNTVFSGKQKYRVEDQPNQYSYKAFR